MSDAQQVEASAIGSEVDEGPVILGDPELTQTSQEQQAEAETTEETPADAETAENETDDSETDQERDEKGRFKKPVQPRIDELTRKAHAAQREAAFWKMRAEQLAQPQTEQAESEPQLEEFEDYGAYVKALTKFEARRHAREVAREMQAETSKAQAANKQQEAFRERTAEARSIYPDYDTVVSESDVPIAQHVSDLILDSEFGPHLSYQIAMHPEIADRLNSLSPIHAAKEIARMEDRVSQAAAPSQKTQPLRRTAAPQPTRPIAAGRSTAPDLEKASMDEYVQLRSKQNPVWRR